jgi:hypothetical protein
MSEWLANRQALPTCPNLGLGFDRRVEPSSVKQPDRRLPACPNRLLKSIDAVAALSRRWILLPLSHE